MKKIFTVICSIGIIVSAHAQEAELTETGHLAQRIGNLESAVISMQKFKVSGYVQTQFQRGEQDAALKVGAPNQSSKPFSRFGIRRGRIKFTYDGSAPVSGVFQLDITEKGVGVKDAYLNIKDPWINTIQLRAGIFDRPFGNEISYSSSRRESPERSMVFQTLFPDERDLGVMLLLQPSKTSPWNILKLEAGLFAGNGIKPETDNRRDFIGHLSALKSWNGVSLGGGVSYYNGAVYQGTSAVYTMDGNAFVADDNDSNIGTFARREYLGFDLQFTALTKAGMTQLRAEYIRGQQPGTAGGSKSPNWTALQAYDTYIRPFSGWYAILVQDIGPLPFSIVAKYDAYDPNRNVKKNEVGFGGTSSADLAYDTFGIGGLWRINNSLRFQAFYEMVKNETSNAVEGFEKDRKDNILTLRLQYKF